MAGMKENQMSKNITGTVKVSSTYFENMFAGEVNIAGLAGDVNAAIGRSEASELVVGNTKVGKGEETTKVTCNLTNKGETAMMVKGFADDIRKLQAKHGAFLVTVPAAYARWGVFKVLAGETTSS